MLILVFLVIIFFFLVFTSWCLLLGFYFLVFNCFCVYSPPLKNLKCLKNLKFKLKFATFCALRICPTVRRPLLRAPPRG